MADEGGIRLNQINEVTKIALAYDIGTCVQCAAAIKAYLKSQKLKGKHIRVETLSQSGLEGIIYDDATNQQIANNGYHEGIIIEIEGVEKVFDNLYPRGKPIELWLQDLVVIPGNRLNWSIVEQF
ncbi:hypothetical protein NIES4071_32540 [Calothrix sp. NIES-4071]|nr:hypothetical protein NIES4071_32540 [Calothrix sp. NIES-4071]BAZ57574.1 hypothetical protein NIES4105_32480 [Calothrix sp. NIES-4105]